MKRIELSNTKREFRFACHPASANRIIHVLYLVAPDYGFYAYAKDDNGVEKAYFSVPSTATEAELTIIDNLIDYLLD